MIGHNFGGGEVMKANLELAITFIKANWKWFVLLVILDAMAKMIIK